MFRLTAISVIFALARLFCGIMLERVMALVSYHHAHLLYEVFFSAFWGLALFLLLAKIENIKQAEQRRVTIVAQMNHHVRNALQVIEYGVWASKDKARFSQIIEAVTVIDWALREILAGNLAHQPVEQHDVPNKEGQVANAL